MKCLVTKVPGKGILFKVIPDRGREKKLNQSVYLDQYLTDQLDQVLREVPSHQSEDRQQRPPKCVIIGVAIVWVETSQQAGETLWTHPEYVIRGRHHHCLYHRSSSL